MNQAEVLYHSSASIPQLREIAMGFSTNKFVRAGMTLTMPDGSQVWFSLPKDTEGMLVVGMPIDTLRFE